MPLIFRHFWIVLIVATIAITAILRARTRRHVAADPSLAVGYRTLLRGYLVCNIIPWVIMGLGCLFGGVPSAVHYLRPRDGNPFVLAFYSSILLMMMASTYWLFSRGGAEMIARHPGLMNVDIRSPSLLKLLWCLSMAGGVAGLIAVWAADGPPPARGW